MRVFESQSDKYYNDDENLPNLFGDFLANVFEFAIVNNFDEKKTSCIIEIAAHVFLKSFDSNMELDKSFNLFK